MTHMSVRFKTVRKRFCAKARCKCVFGMLLSLALVLGVVAYSAPSATAATGRSHNLEFVNDELQTTRVANVSSDLFSESAENLRNPERGLYHIKQFVITNTPQGQSYYEADIGWFCQMWSPRWNDEKINRPPIREGDLLCEQLSFFWKNSLYLHNLCDKILINQYDSIGGMNYEPAGLLVQGRVGWGV